MSVTLRVVAYLEENGEKGTNAVLVVMMDRSIAVVAAVVALIIVDTLLLVACVWLVCC